MKTRLVKLGVMKVPSPMYGDLILNLFPTYTNKVHLPPEFSSFQETVNKILSNVPVDKDSSNEHFVTIHSKYFPQDESLRREGLHIDGNFCADPTFQGDTWGGTGIQTWGGTRLEAIKEGNYKIITPWVSPYNTEIPLGEYVSEKLGGILMISDLEGCDVYHGNIDMNVGNQGDLSHDEANIKEQATKEILEANNLYFMTSNTPHQSNIIKAGNRRTLIRVTLAHDYRNELIAA